MQENVTSNVIQVPVGYNPEFAQAAFEHFKGVAKTIPPQNVERLNVDPNEAVLRALRVGSFAQRPDILARFQQLTTADFNIQYVYDLPRLAWAMYFAGIQGAQHEAAASEAKVPAALANEASMVRNRMFRVVEYLLGDHPVERAEIDDIRSGNGYLDLIRDLERLAGMYNRHTSLVAMDIKYYLDTDAATAQQLAVTMTQRLSEGLAPSHREHVDLMARIYTLLRISYNEVRAAAAWLFRKQPDVLLEFPSLKSSSNGVTPAHPKAEIESQSAPV